MTDSIQHALENLVAGKDLSEQQMQSAIDAVMEGRVSPVVISALLTALRVKGETAEEVAGAARAMRMHALSIPTQRTGLMDTCGTGGDRLHTFNVSTATALVVAAAGVPIAKHGNKSVSSASGSADVLQELGVNIELTPEQAGRCLDEVGLCFCFARIHHTAMRHVAPIRAELGFRTIFNLLGPLTNPAGAEFQLLGACDLTTAQKLAGALQRLGTKRAFVVCGNGELDEVALWGETTVFEVAGSRVRQQGWSADTFALPECQVNDLRVDSPRSSADCIRRILEGEPGPPRNIVVANAAAALSVVDAKLPLDEAARRVEQVLDDGGAQQMLKSLIETSQALATC